MTSDSSSEFDPVRLAASGNDVDRQNRGFEEWHNEPGLDPYLNGGSIYDEPGLSIWSPSDLDLLRGSNSELFPCKEPRDAVLPLVNTSSDYSHDIEHHAEPVAEESYDDIVTWSPKSDAEDSNAIDAAYAWDQNEGLPKTSVGDSAIDLSQDKSPGSSFEIGPGARGTTGHNHSALDQDEPSDENRGEREMQQSNIVIDQDKTQDTVTCPECSKRLERRGIKKHVERVHYKKRGCSCTVCEKTFYSAKDLKDHQSSHKQLREVVYICPDERCHRNKKGFTRPDNAYRHVKDKHNHLLRRDAEGKVVKGCVIFQTVQYKRPSDSTA